MIYKDLIYMCVLIILLPAWIGVLWVSRISLKGRLSRFCNAWMLGTVTMFAVGQIILVPMIFSERTLTDAVNLWKLLLTVLAVLSFLDVLCQKAVRSGDEERREAVFIRLPRAGEELPEKAAEPAGTLRENRNKAVWTVIFGVLAAVLIFIQAYIPMKYQHIDDDDARYVSEEVSAVVHDTLLKDDPITADFMYWDVGEVKKDLTSPWTMHVAMYCRIAGIAPAVFSHTYFPFFMIITCYVLYGMIGNVLFGRDKEKLFLFLIFLSALHIWGYTSTHTLGAMFLLRIWQGKAMVAGFILPLLFYLFYRIYTSGKRAGRWIAPLYAVSFAASLLSGMGIVMAPIMLAVYGLLHLLYSRNVKQTLAVWAAVAPCGLYLIFYLTGI